MKVLPAPLAMIAAIGVLGQIPTLPTLSTIKDVAVDEPTTNAGTPAVLFTESLAKGLDVPMLIFPAVDTSVPIVVEA
jgi:hypothetical protein